MTSPTVRKKLGRMTYEEKNTRLPMKLGPPTPYAISQARVKTMQEIGRAIAQGMKPESVRPTRPTQQHLGHGAQIAIRDGRHRLLTTNPNRGG